MGLDKKDLEMTSVSIPVVDWWDIQEEINRLQEKINRVEDIADRLERIAEALIALYKEERVKNWTMILQAMLEKQETRKGKWE